MIRKISGKTKSPSYTLLNHPVAETKSTSKFDIAETLGETFLNNSCSRNYSEKFQKVKAEQEKIKLNRRMAENGFAPPPLGNFADISYLVEN